LGWGGNLDYLVAGFSWLDWEFFYSVNISIRRERKKEIEMNPEIKALARLNKLKSYLFGTTLPIGLATRRVAAKSAKRRREREEMRALGITSKRAFRKLQKKQRMEKVDGE
jgi:hypothetical protein